MKKSKILVQKNMWNKFSLKISKMLEKNVLIRMERLDEAQNLKIL